MGVNMGRENNNKPSLKIIIMIMVTISPWGSPNLQYLDIGGRGSRRLGNPGLEHIFQKQE